MEKLLNLSVIKGREILELEKAKKKRLEKIESESWIKLINLKLDDISYVSNEVSTIRIDLEESRERLLNDFNRRN